MGATDGTVVGTAKIVDHGSPTSRFNLVLLADGYRQPELAKFASDTRSFVNRLFALQPFDALRCAFNVYRVDVTSTDSGADDPASCGGTGATPATFFDAAFCLNNLPRLMGVNVTLVRTVADQEVPQWHQLIVVVNSSKWGGAGGKIAVTSTTSGWENVAIHELGHSQFGLADEYDYYKGCGQETDRDRYTGAEPTEPNVTTVTNRTLNKWKDLVAAATAMPTMSNPSCTDCDRRPSSVATGTVGAFEGARFYHCGMFRSEYDCMMRNVGKPFCAVCRRAITAKLTGFLAPCYAPVFAGTGTGGCGCLGLLSPQQACAIQNVGYVLRLAALSRRAGDSAVDCEIKQIQFRMRNCVRGNSDPCIEL